MNRAVEGFVFEQGFSTLNFGHFDVTTRVEVAPIFTPSAVGPMARFDGATLDDIYVSRNFLVYEIGKYDLFMYCTTTPSSGNAVFKINNEIIGFIDFYSKQTNITIRKIEGIIFTGIKKVSISITTDSQNGDSTGYDIIIGDMWLEKRQ